MKIQKYNIIISGVLCVLSFIVAIIIYEESNQFWSNILIGIFSSSMLVLLLSTVSYRIERRKTLERFYTCVYEVKSNINKYQKFEDPKKTMNVVLEINKYNYMEFDMSFGDIEFLIWNKKNMNYIYNNIYKKIIDFRNLINEKSFHFNEYNNAKHGNLAVMELFINEIDATIMHRSEKKVINSDGSETKIRYSYNKLSKYLSEELSGEFYEMIYGNKY